MEEQKRNITLELTEGTILAVRRIAESVDVLTTSGTFHGQGSISGLLTRIADGTIDFQQLARAQAQAARREALSDD